MASIRKRGKTWRAEVRLRGKYASESFATKLEAQSWATETEAEIIALARGQLPKKTLGQAFDRYAAEVSPKKRGMRWEVVRLAKLGENKLARITLADLSPAHLATWRDDRLRQVSAPTVRREMSLLGSVLETCRRDWAWLHENPLREVRRPPPRPARRRGASPEEITRITTALGYEPGVPAMTLQQQVAVAWLLSIETAMRQGELLGLQPADVHLDRRYVALQETKNGDRRDVPLSTRAVELLRQVMTDEAVFTVRAGTADVYFRAARDAAKCKGVHFHDARSEALTRLSKKLDVLALARMVGHRDPRSLMIYYNASASELAERLD